MSQKTKICFFTRYFPVMQGGAEYQTYLIARHLDPEKYNVFFISMGGEEDGMSIIDGHRIYDIKTNRLLCRLGKHYYLYYRKIKKILKKERPDIVYRRMPSSIAAILSYLSGKLNFKFIWACANDPDLYKFKIGGFRNIFNDFDNFLGKYGISRAGAILVQSNFQKQMLKENFGRDCYLVPKCLPEPDDHIIKEKNSIKVVWIANIKNAKQPEIFIALAKEFRDYPKVNFVMIGRTADNKYQQHFEESIKGLDNLEYLGEKPIEEVNRILSESHIFVNTSKYEGGAPNTFIQAWMRKIPVVSLNVNPDGILDKERIGFFSRTYKQLVKDVWFLLKNENRRKQMGEKAKKYAEEKFNINKNITMLERVFKDILAK
jgi:glycosyltransferase involved in cell wall biosynthesis